MDEHTPTPWYHRQAGEKSPHGEYYDWIADDPRRGMHRKIIIQRHSCEPADYAFIVKAVNNHDALVEAMKLIADWRNCNISGEYEHSLRDIIRSMTDVATAALEKVAAR